MASKAETVMVKELPAVGLVAVLVTLKCVTVGASTEMLLDPPATLPLVLSDASTNLLPVCVRTMLNVCTP